MNIKKSLTFVSLLLKVVFMIMAAVFIVSEQFANRIFNGEI